MSWADYAALFDDLLGGLVRELAPDRPYIPSSEHNPTGDRTQPGNADSGDAHLWNVWFNGDPFEWYRGCMHRFCSEFGFQSLPTPPTVAAFTEPGERNLTSRILEHHQRSSIGNSAMMDYLLSWFRLPTSFNSCVYLTQIVQAYAIKYAVEHWRRHMPRCMGAVYWQLNDCWPGPSWASIDSFGRWKALQYEAKRFFEPLHLSLWEDLEARTVGLWMNNDHLESVEGSWELTLTDLDGQVVHQLTGTTTLAAGQPALIETAEFAGLLENHPLHTLLVWGAWRDGDGRLVSRNMMTLARPKHLDLPDPGIQIAHTGEGIDLQAEKPALFVWLESEDPDARFSDNFFHLPAGVPYRVRQVKGDPAAGLTVRNLTDTYREA
jgi:beta-mannosidase